MTRAQESIASANALLAAHTRSFVDSTTSSTRTATWYGSVTGVSNSLTNLRVTYRGKSSRSCSQRVSIWKWTGTGGSWVKLDSRSVGTSEVEITAVPGGTLADYVSGDTGDGEVRVQVRWTNGSNSFTYSGELLRLTYDRP